jgi:diguanylate cyclase (GGDEF)-like protein
VSTHGSRQATDRIDALLDKGFPWLRFPLDLERRFQSETLPRRRRHFLVSGIISLLVYNGFLVADYLMTPDVFVLGLLLRIGLFTPLSAAFLYLVYKGRLNWIDRHAPFLYDLLAVVGGLIAAGSLAIILSYTSSPYVPYYHTGFMVVMVYGTTVQRLRFWWALFFSVSVLTMHVLTAWLAPGFDPVFLPPIASLILSMTLFVLAANYMMERDERRRHLLLLRDRALVADLTQTHQRLRNLSRVDTVTGLYNRRHVQEYLPQAWARLQHDQGRMALLMVNVDHFKKYHDRYGMVASEACLREVAQSVQDCTRRPTDVVARYDDDTFVAILPDADPAQASAMAERIRQAVEGRQLRHAASATSRHVTVSVGVVIVQAEPERGPEMLIESAEQALEEAKSGGRNRISVRVIPPPAAPFRASVA